MQDSQEGRALEEGLVERFCCSGEAALSLVPSVMVHCNKLSDGRASAARKGGIWCEEDAATRRVKKRWFGRNIGVKVGVMVELEIARKGE